MKIPALLFNRSVLSGQPGVLYSFNAVAEKEDDNKMNWPGQSVLHLPIYACLEKVGIAKKLYHGGVMWNGE